MPAIRCTIGIGMTKNKKTDITEERWKVTYGPEKEADRSVKFFPDEIGAQFWFEEQQARGRHVDAYKITTRTIETIEHVS